MNTWIDYSADFLASERAPQSRRRSGLCYTEKRYIKWSKHLA